MWALVDVCVLTVTDMTNSSDTYGFDVSCVLTVMTNSSDTYGFDVSFSWCLCADGYRYDPSRFDVSFSWCLCADGYRYDQQ